MFADLAPPTPLTRPDQRRSAPLQPAAAEGGVTGFSVVFEHISSQRAPLEPAGSPTAHTATASPDPQADMDDTATDTRGGELPETDSVQCGGAVGSGAGLTDTRTQTAAPQGADGTQPTPEHPRGADRGRPEMVHAVFYAIAAKTAEAPDMPGVQTAAAAALTGTGGTDMNRQPFNSPLMAANTQVAAGTASDRPAVADHAAPLLRPLMAAGGGRQRLEPALMPDPSTRQPVGLTSEKFPAPAALAATGMPMPSVPGGAAAQTPPPPVDAGAAVTQQVAQPAGNPPTPAPATADVMRWHPAPPGPTLEPTGAEAGLSALREPAGGGPVGPMASTTAPATTDPNARPVLAQLSAQILRQPEGRVDIALDPVELGRVEMSFQPRDGGLTLSLTVERPETLELIRRHIGLLQDDLRALGMGQVDLRMDLSGNGTHRNPPWSAAPAITAPIPTADLTPDAQPATRRLAAPDTGRLDLRL